MLVSLPDRRGVAGGKPESDFRMAFRDLNRLYLELKRQERSKPPATQRKQAVSRAA